MWDISYKITIPIFRYSYSFLAPLRGEYQKNGIIGIRRLNSAIFGAFILVSFWYSNGMNTKINGKNSRNNQVKSHKFQLYQFKKGTKWIKYTQAEHRL